MATVLVAIARAERIHVCRPAVGIVVARPCLPLLAEATAPTGCAAALVQDRVVDAVPVTPVDGGTRCAFEGRL